jgi:hypothetical protein
VRLQYQKKIFEIVTRESVDAVVREGDERPVYTIHEFLVARHHATQLGWIPTFVS